LSEFDEAEIDDSGILKMKILGLKLFSQSYDFFGVTATRTEKSIEDSDILFLSRPSFPVEAKGSRIMRGQN
jgi:hypothetical protein